jgi:hemerythrin-like domain-containing protein
MRPLPVQPRIDDPMALLRACHDKVRHFTTLIQRLRTHVDTHGADAQARDAAVAVRRYFTLAAPLHHDDEDVDLYPALKTLGDAALNARVDALSAEHAQLSGLWQALRPWLDALALEQMPAGALPDVDAFALRYRAHAQAEEDELYPYAARLNAATRLRLAAAMSARRSVSSPTPDAV